VDGGVLDISENGIGSGVDEENLIGDNLIYHLFFLEISAVNIYLILTSL
jgi:hypothetical protein